MTLTPTEERVLGELFRSEPRFRTAADVAEAIGERRSVVYSALSELRKRELVTRGTRGPRPEFACTTLGEAEVGPHHRGSRA